MYLVPIQVPIYLDRAGRHLVTTEWKRSLTLLRDSFEARLGEIVVLAPFLPSAAATSQLLEPLPSDGLRAVTPIPADCKAREYWKKHRREWLAALDELLPNAQVVHAGLDDLYKPLAFDGFVRAVRRGIPSVFVQDTDLVEQIRQRATDAPTMDRARSWAYRVGFERATRWGVKHADLSLLKGRALMERYGGDARNAHAFQDTSHSERDVITPDRLRARLATLNGRPLRLVYCGRLVERKGVDRSIRLIRGARERAAEVTLDIIGDGPQREELVRLASGLPVRFLGSRPYGPELLRDLGEYDALLFTPPAEDTPRMVFDAYAAGLPILGSGIAYLRERTDEDGSGMILPDSDGLAADFLASLTKDRGRLVSLSESAARAGRVHSAESWYRRRAEWTFEIINTRRSSCGAPTQKREAVRA